MEIKMKVLGVTEQDIADEMKRQESIQVEFPLRMPEVDEVNEVSKINTNNNRVVVGNWDGEPIWRYKTAADNIKN